MEYDTFGLLNTENNILRRQLSNHTLFRTGSDLNRPRLGQICIKLHTLFRTKRPKTCLVQWHFPVQAKYGSNPPPGIVTLLEKFLDPAPVRDSFHFRQAMSTTHASYFSYPYHVFVLQILQKNPQLQRWDNFIR